MQCHYGCGKIAVFKNHAETNWLILCNYLFGCQYCKLWRNLKCDSEAIYDLKSGTEIATKERAQL